MNLGMSEPGCRRVMLGAMVPVAAMALFAISRDAMVYRDMSCVVMDA